MPALSVEIVFPLEFIVLGVPVSFRAKLAASIEAWKERVRAAARPYLPEGHWATEGPVQITIFYFPDAEIRGDLDNILKPILDALSKFVYLDDGQVERIVVQKFEPARIGAFLDPSAKLAEAALTAGPRVYVKVDVPHIEELSND